MFELVNAFINKWLLSPFSNKVTKIILYTGAGIVAAPMIEHLIIKIILQEIFSIDIPINIPDAPAYIAGGVLMAMGAMHNIGFQYLNLIKEKHNDAKISKNEQKQKPHDKKIIKEILGLLPYEDVSYWLEQAGYAGVRRDFYHGLETCLKFKTPPFSLFNENLEVSKIKLIDSIEQFTNECMGHLGAQENPRGDMYLPPYHWKSQGPKSEAKYYEQVESVGKAGQVVRSELDTFIKVVKEEGFVV